MENKEQTSQESTGKSNNTVSFKLSGEAAAVIAITVSATLIATGALLHRLFSK